MGAQHEDDKSDKIVSADKDISDELELKAKKYLRGEGANLEALQDKKLKGQLAVKEDLHSRTAKAAARVEKYLVPGEEGCLEPDGLQKTYRVKQKEIINAVDILSSKKAFDLVFPELGPYTIDYTPNGRYMAVAGRKGHLGIIDTKNRRPVREMQVGETVRDVAFLHNELMFAVAQKKYTYIYSKDKTELHCLEDHIAVVKLQSLNAHFLLASMNKFGQLRYQDTTTGNIVANFRTGMGRCDVMELNPYNAIIGLGHSCGKVTMWKPTISTPLVQMLCHHGPISAMAFHPGGNLMATAGMDRKIKLWDLRMNYKQLHSFAGSAKTLQFSQKGALAFTNGGSFVQIWKDSSGDQKYRPYMSHQMEKGYQVGKVMFQPYEDVLGLGHSMGISTILVPGSGEPNFDSWVANPFETPKQRREKEVHNLLDKLPPETIMMDPTKIGTMRPAKKKEQQTKEEREAEMEAAIAAVRKAPLKKKTKGRSKPSKIESKKQEGVIKAKRPFVDQQMKEEEQISKKKQRLIDETQLLPKALQRFSRNKAK